MQYDTSTPRNARTIAGLSLSVIAPYGEGHVLTPAEAAILNQTIAENFSNNTRKTIEAGIDDGQGNVTPHTVETAQALLDEYMAGYEPGVRRSGDGSTARVTDPIEREARKIARTKVLDHMKARGLKTKDIGAEKVAELVDGVFEKNRDALMAQGKKVVAALQKAQEQTDGLDFGLDFGAEPEPEAAA